MHQDNNKLLTQGSVLSYRTVTTTPFMYSFVTASGASIVKSCPYHQSNCRTMAVKGPLWWVWCKWCPCGWYVWS